MKTTSPITLLIVDDEPEIRSGLRSIIPWEQFSISVVGTSANGTDALNQIRYYEPDIVITDIQMPGMNGLELVRRAKDEQFNCSFIILSGYDDFQYAKTAIKYGVSDYLLKPISIKELTELIQRLAEDIQSHRSLHTDQLSTLSELRNAQISLRQNDLIPQLLRSELSAAQLKQAIKDYSLPIKDQESCVVLIQAFSPQADTEDSTDMSPTLKPLCTSLEENLGAAGFLLSSLPAGLLLLIINLPFTASGKRNLPQLLNEVINAAIPSGQAQMTAAIGKPVSSLLDISASYNSARQILSWHIYPEMKHILESSLLEIPQPPIIMPSADIWEAVLKNDMEAIHTHFDDYLQQLLASSTPPPAYLYSMCNYLIITIQNEMAQHLDAPIHSFTDNSYATLQNLPSLDQIRSWMYQVLCDLSSQLRINRVTKNDPLIEKAISYIHINLLNNPHAEDVCSYLGLSKSYFSTYFKTKTSLTFRDYTLNLKISYAREQLKHPERSPGEVALILGYEDYRSFSRAFKTRTGFSPSDYQKQYTSSERNSVC